MIKVGIIGATGYAGEELVRLLYPRKDVEIVWLGSQSYVDQSFSSVYKNYFQIIEKVCSGEKISELAKNVDLIFTATPSGYCSSIINDEILSMVKVIDLSADFRIKDLNIYEEWYQMKHPGPEFINRAVYGLPEVNRNQIKEASLVANPGCYPTCSFLTIYPLLQEKLIDPSNLIIDAKSGVSGAGRSAKIPNLFCEVSETIKAYGVATHRHTPEIEQQLSLISNQEIKLNFTPHLIPMSRGILITAYGNLIKDISQQEVKAVYQKYYSNEKFVRVLEGNDIPETRWVKGSNFVDVNVKVDKRTNRVIMMGAMDNLVKGAAGQAVQNMNLMFGCEEQAGLDLIPMFP